MVLRIKCCGFEKKKALYSFKVHLFSILVYKNTYLSVTMHTLTYFIIISFYNSVFY